MPRALLAALLVALAACRPPTVATAALEALPSAAEANPFAPVWVKFTLAGTGCDVDPATLDGALTLTPAPPATPRLLLDPAKCVLTLVEPGSLPPGATYTAKVGGKLRTLDGRAVTLPKVPTLAFTTAASYPAGEAPPEFIGSWPPAGDDRLGRAEPVRLFFSGPIASTAKVADPASGATVAVEPSTYSVVVTPTTAWPAGSLTVRVRDLVDLAGAPVTAPGIPLVRPASADARAPNFGGAESAAPDPGSGTLAVAWQPATDDVSASDAIRYLVYAGPLGTPPDFTVPALVTAPGATAATLELPDGGVEISVRAEDEAGNVDDNVITVEVR